MKKALKYFLLILPCLSGVNVKGQEWELQKKHDNIEVYFRKTDDITYEIRVKAIYNTDPESFIEIIENYKSYPQWVYRCTQSEIVSVKGKLYLRTVTDIPWPLKDRDAIVMVIPPRKRNDVVILSSTACPNAVPIYENTVRQNYSNVIWRIQKKEKYKTFVDYTLTLKVEENIPDFIMKMVTTNGPYETFKNLQKMIENKATSF